MCSSCDEFLYFYWNYDFSQCLTLKNKRCIRYFYWTKEAKDFKCKMYKQKQPDENFVWIIKCLKWRLQMWADSFLFGAADAVCLVPKRHRSSIPSPDNVFIFLTSDQWGKHAWWITVKWYQMSHLFLFILVIIVNRVTVTCHRKDSPVRDNVVERQRCGNDLWTCQYCSLLGRGSFSFVLRRLCCLLVSIRWGFRRTRCWRRCF